MHDLRYVTRFNHPLTIIAGAGEELMLRLCFDARRYDSAVKDYSEAIRINPRDADNFYNRGNSYLALDNKNEAINDYDEAVSLDSKLADAFYNRGIAYADLGQHGNALRDFSATLAAELGSRRVGQADVMLARIARRTGLSPHDL